MMENPCASTKPAMVKRHSAETLANFAARVFVNSVIVINVTSPLPGPHRKPRITLYEVDSEAMVVEMERVVSTIPALVSRIKR